MKKKTNKKNIIIVECISSSVNYIQDIYDEGYTPVLLEPYSNIWERSYWRKFHDHELEIMLDSRYPRPEIIMAPKDYKDTLRMVEKLNPVAVIPGSDRGIALATQLSYDLGLQNNDPKNLPKMRNKYLSQEALKECGARYIESLLTADYTEALSFYKRLKEQGKAVVVKPVSGISSMGVFVCESEEELKQAFKSNIKNKIYTMFNGDTGKVLLQEYIKGTEYVVNTVSCNGVHKVTSLYKYIRRTLPGKGKIYDCVISVDDNDPFINDLIAYQMKVLEALSIKYGPIHSEIMVDENGPVLIEANCRLCGFDMRSSLLDEAFGMHESLVALKSYLEDDFSADFDERNIIINFDKCIIIKMVNLDKSTYVKGLYIDEVCEEMPEYRYYNCRKRKGFYSESINLSTVLSNIYFVCKNEESAMQCFDSIKWIEENCPQKLFTKIDIPILCKIASKFMS